MGKDLHLVNAAGRVVRVPEKHAESLMRRGDFREARQREVNENAYAEKHKSKYKTKFK